MKTYQPYALIFLYLSSLIASAEPSLEGQSLPHTHHGQQEHIHPLPSSGVNHEHDPNDFRKMSAIHKNDRDYTQLCNQLILQKEINKYEKCGLPDKKWQVLVDGRAVSCSDENTSISKELLNKRGKDLYTCLDKKSSPIKQDFNKDAVDDMVYLYRKSTDDKPILVTFLSKDKALEFIPTEINMKYSLDGTKFELQYFKKREAIKLTTYTQVKGYNVRSGYEVLLKNIDKGWKIVALLYKQGGENIFNYSDNNTFYYDFISKEFYSTLNYHNGQSQTGTDTIILGHLNQDAKILSLNNLFSIMDYDQRKQYNKDNIKIQSEKSCGYPKEYYCKPDIYVGDVTMNLSGDACFAPEKPFCDKKSDKEYKKYSTLKFD